MMEIKKHLSSSSKTGRTSHNDRLQVARLCNEWNGDITFPNVGLFPNCISSGIMTNQCCFSESA